MQARRREREQASDPRGDGTSAVPPPWIERFCVALCHDLRGPLAAAEAALERLSAIDALGDGAAGRRLRRATGIGGSAARDATGGTELLAIAHRSLRQAEELLASLPGLLAAERAPRLDRVDLGDVVRAAAADVEVELRLAGGRLAAAPDLPVALGHAERLRIALRNLLRNAIRHRRGEVALEISVAAERSAGGAALVVSDNGSGIPRREQRRVFAPLERAAGARGAGSGLGLAIARRAVEACGGRLELRPRHGPGACFAISLRAAGSGAAASRP